MSDLHLTCKYESHKDENIQAVCVSKNCNQPKLCCFYCVQEGRHSQHYKEVLKLSLFDQWRLDAVSILNQIKQIITEQENLLKLLEELIFENQKAINLDLGFATATEIDESVNKINNLKNIDNSIKEDFEILNKTNCIIRKKLKELQPQIRQVESLKLSVFMKDLKQSKPGRPLFKFSQQNKLNNIQIEDNGRVAKLQQESLYGGFCLCDSNLPIVGDCSFSFKYISGIVYLGICNRDIIQKANYAPPLINIGHGSYLIRNDGTSYCHHDDEMNYLSQSFKFTENDIITVKVNIQQQQITWIKQKTNETFAMQLDEEIQEYCACVYLIQLFGPTQIGIVENI